MGCVGGDLGAEVFKVGVCCGEGGDEVLVGVGPGGEW